MYLIDRFSQLLRCEVVLHLINTYIYQVFTTGSNFNHLAVFFLACFSMFSPLFSCFSILSPVFSCFPKFSLFPCFPMFSPVFLPIFLCFLLSSNISPCFSSSSSVFLCCFLCPYDSPCFLLFLLILIPMFSSVIPCFPMFPTVFICFPCFPMFSKVLYGEPSFIYHFLQKMYPVWKAYHISMRFSLHLF